jgi:hypothetical protein
MRTFKRLAEIVVVAGALYFGVEWYRRRSGK